MGPITDTNSQDRPSKTVEVIVIQFQHPTHRILREKQSNEPWLG